MSVCPHCKGAIPSAASAVLPATVPSTTEEAQEDFMLQMLRDAGATGATTDDFRTAGVFQVSARIFGLRARGIVIDTERYSGYGADNVWHKGMARYRLISETPLEAGAAREAAKSGAGATDGGEAACQ